MNEHNESKMPTIGKLESLDFAAKQARADQVGQMIAKGVDALMSRIPRLVDERGTGRLGHA